MSEDLEGKRVDEDTRKFLEDTKIKIKNALHEKG